MRQGSDDCKPKWWLELDLFYCKDFLDDLQLHVQCSVAKVGQVTQQQTRLSLTTRKKKRNSDMSTASVSIFQPGTIAFKKEKPVKCQYRRKSERSSTADGTEDARRTAWRLRVEESQKFVDRLVPTYPQPVHSARQTPMAKTCSQCNAMQKSQVMKSAQFETKIERNFMKSSASQNAVQHRVACEKTRLIQREGDHAVRNVWHVQQVLESMSNDVKEKVFVLSFMAAMRHLAALHSWMFARARRSLLLEIRMETIVNTCTNRRCKLKGCGPFNEYASEGPAQAQLGGKTFVPLPSFMPGDDRFKNTCFIAAVVNLSSVLPAIGQALRLEQNSWGDVIRLARSLDNNKYAYAQQHGGQHDAAELLGDCLWHDGAVGVGIIQRTPAVDCNHEWTTSVRNVMLVLELPLDYYGPRSHSM